ncbi:hypothetical protein NI17_015170 [Thermobifida halotolerans]|uniref:Uncharacterized protein n=1 Tax=Thermobifida halotolerans TaxID=483545 RepID=A0A399G0W7_9ACTN|nr:hypothetical protein [Thermobifida halotolerans]UOE18183.1 hypothetical protein NI17_015170 [Thermobifida halotolerans]
MVYTRRSARTVVPAMVLARSSQRRHLARLAEALAPHGIWARVFEDGRPFLRVSNPESEFAVEDVTCERRENGHVFVTSFGMYLGDCDDLDRSVERTARLLGVTPV